MARKISQTSQGSIDPGLIAEAARLIRAGKLVAFPTETVYGLGANALDEAAVDAIFEAKGRPPTSPLIVHVDSVEMARTVVAEWPENARKLAERCWPGPLTLVLAKQADIPARVTAGLGTVGIRIPRHPIALALIRRARLPIAAPSANVFMGLSPTQADHVRRSLGSRVAMVLDGGPTEVGLESTVLSLSGGESVLLRPGMIALRELEELIGPIRIAGPEPEDAAHAAPGMHARHYSPKTPLVLTSPGSPLPPGRGVSLYLTAPNPGARPVRMPGHPDAYAATLYSTLHSLDAENWDWIAVERPPERPEWVAILDRLKRASTE